MTLPTKLNTAIACALTTLEREIGCTLEEANSHRVVCVQGMAKPVVVDAIGVYLVGLLASAVSRTLLVRSQITDTTQDRLELLENTRRIVGSVEAPLTTDQKQDQRNPWIAEGLWHLCLLLASRSENLHPPGRIVALDYPHVSAKDHGLDVVAIYRSADTFGISIVESKAYENDPNGAINDATRTFKAIDRGDHDTRLRQFVAAAREALPSEDQERISPSLWKDTRAYIPNPHYDDSRTMDWTNSRPSFKELVVPAERIYVMPHAIPGFAAFFDAVGASMLRFAESLNV